MNSQYKNIVSSTQNKRKRKFPSNHTQTTSTSTSLPTSFVYSYDTTHLLESTIYCVSVAISKSVNLNRENRLKLINSPPEAINKSSNVSLVQYFFANYKLDSLNKISDSWYNFKKSNNFHQIINELKHDSIKSDPKTCFVVSSSFSLPDSLYSQLNLFMHYKLFLNKPCDHSFIDSYNDFFTVSKLNSFQRFVKRVDTFLDVYLRTWKKNSWFITSKANIKSSITELNSQELVLRQPPWKPYVIYYYDEIDINDQYLVIPASLIDYPISTSSSLKIYEKCVPFKYLNNIYSELKKQKSNHWTSRYSDGVLIFETFGRTTSLSSSCLASGSVSFQPKIEGSYSTSVEARYLVSLRNLKNVPSNQAYIIYVVLDETNVFSTICFERQTINPIAPLTDWVSLHVVGICNNHYVTNSTNPYIESVCNILTAQNRSSDDIMEEEKHTQSETNDSQDYDLINYNNDFPKISSFFSHDINESNKSSEIYPDNILLYETSHMKLIKNDSPNIIVWKLTSFKYLSNGIIYIMFDLNTKSWMVWMFGLLNFFYHKELCRRLNASHEFLTNDLNLISNFMEFSFQDNDPVIAFQEFSSFWNHLMILNEMIRDFEHDSTPQLILVSFLDERFQFSFAQVEKYALQNNLNLFRR